MSAGAEAEQRFAAECLMSRPAIANTFGVTSQRVSNDEGYWAPRIRLHGTKDANHSKVLVR